MPRDSAIQINLRFAVNALIGAAFGGISTFGTTAYLRSIVVTGPRRNGTGSALLQHLLATARAEAAKEDEVQASVMRKATETEGAKILASAESEIDTLTRAARLDLKAYAAKLAVDLAEERIKSRMTPEAQGKLVQSYVQDLGELSASSGGKN